MTHALTLTSLILSGDIGAAETYMGGRCAGRTWAHGEAIGIRNACAKWGIDAARFSAGRAPIVCPPELWSVRAHLICGEVPVYPTDEDFQRAAMSATSEFPEPAYVWRMEAIRSRRGPGYGKPLDLPVVQAATEAAVARLTARWTP